MSQRVSFIRVTLEYFEVDLEHDYMKVEENAVRIIKEQPARHQLGRSDVAWICTGTRRI